MRSSCSKLLGRLHPGDRSPDLFGQLEWLFIHRHHRTCRVVRFLVDYQYNLHGIHEFAVRLRRYHPIPDPPPCDAVFFRDCRIVSGLIFSTIPRSPPDWQGAEGIIGNGPSGIFQDGSQSIGSPADRSKSFDAAVWVGPFFPGRLQNQG